MASTAFDRSSSVLAGPREVAQWSPYVNNGGYVEGGLASGGGAVGGEKTDGEVGE